MVFSVHRSDHCLLFLIFQFQVNYNKAIKESQQLIEKNGQLRNRLRDVVDSPLSDAEKQQIIDDSEHRLQSSNVKYNIGYNFNTLSYVRSKEMYLIQLFLVIFNQKNGDGSSCHTTPDLDKHSSSSEVSKTCLQDIIILVCTVYTNDENNFQLR